MGDIRDLINASSRRASLGSVEDLPRRKGPLSCTHGATLWARRLRDGIGVGMWADWLHVS